MKDREAGRACGRIRSAAGNSFADFAGSDGRSVSAVFVDCGGECGRNGCVRRAVDEARRDCGVVRGVSPTEHRRIPDQSLDSRAAAEARCGTGAAAARISRAVGTGGAGECGRRCAAGSPDAARFRADHFVAGFGDFSRTRANPCRRCSFRYSSGAVRIAPGPDCGVARDTCQGAPLFLGVGDPEAPDRARSRRSWLPCRHVRPEALSCHATHASQKAAEIGEIFAEGELSR